MRQPRGYGVRVKFLDEWPVLRALQEHGHFRSSKQKAVALLVQGVPVVFLRSHAHSSVSLRMWAIAICMRLGNGGNVTSMKLHREVGVT